MVNNKKKKTVEKSHALRSKSTKVTKPYETPASKRVTSNPIPVVGPTSSLAFKKQKTVDFPSTSTFSDTFKVISPSSSTNIATNISSENSDMLIDPLEGNDQQGGQKSPATTGNPLNLCNFSFVRPEEFTISTDLRSIPGTTNDDKHRSIDFHFKDNADYIGHRIVNYRGRLIFKVYFLSESSTKAACTPTTSIHDKDPRMKISFTMFNKMFIEKDICSQCTKEEPNTLRATCIPPELSYQQLQD